jgi:uncharacterized surface protein with fasciclin (FAS1) repeats
MQTVQNMLRVSLLFSLMFVAALPFAQKNAGQHGTMEMRAVPSPLFKRLEEMGQFKTLVSLIKSAGLDKELNEKSLKTVLAPTDAAFRLIPKKTMESYAKDKPKLRKLILNHVLSGHYGSVRLSKLKEVISLSAIKHSVKVNKGTIAVGGAKVTKKDTTARNGIIQTIDKVLLLPTK